MSCTLIAVVLLSCQLCSGPIENSLAGPNNITLSISGWTFDYDRCWTRYSRIHLLLQTTEQPRATCSLTLTMVGLSSDTITLPLLPRVVPWSTARSNRKFIPVAVTRNASPLRQVNETRHLHGHPWPEWARISLFVGIGLATLLLIILLAFLCSRRRQRDNMKTVSQKDNAAYESTSTVGLQQDDKLPYSQVSYGEFATEAGDVTHPQQAMALPRPLGAQGLSPNNNGMYDVPLETSYGYGPIDPFGPGQHVQHADSGVWRSNSHRSIGTSTMTSQSAAPVMDQGSAFSPWDSPTKKKFKF